MYSLETVHFLDSTPVIDGVLNSDYENRLNSFKDIHKTDPSLPDLEASYFLGYSADFLYVYIQSEGGPFIINDRAYQNGDGFHLTLGKPMDGNVPTDKFYVLGFSPAKDWSNKFCWYKDIDLCMKILADDVLFETAEINGKISFELLLPWREVTPYHPWLYENLAFNLCFVKSIRKGTNDRILYFIKTDQRMQSEQSKRKYINLSFAQPEDSKIPNIYAMPARNNFKYLEDLKIDIAGYTNNSEIQIGLFNMEGKNILTRSIQLPPQKGFVKSRIIIDNIDLKPGQYMIKINDTEHEVFILEPFCRHTIKKTISEHRPVLSDGSVNTMLFHLKEVSDRIKDLKRYDDPQFISTKIRELSDLMDSVKRKEDPFISKRGTYRRAFISDIDAQLRPYSIYVPEDYRHEKKYPLLIYLHGSGEDDTALFRADFLRDEFIVLAPNGRGTSNWYATAESQMDIGEAIKDVIKNFNIKTDRIILSGFSMGGYGVYRTFFENPGMYHALAVISGTPKIPQSFRSDGIRSRHEITVSFLSLGNIV